ncbi:hypothetical protein ACP70R_027450 [Stipagrostis hirtigluma subsp. patula]
MAAQGYLARGVWEVPRRAGDTSGPLPVHTTSSTECRSQTGRHSFEDRWGPKTFNMSRSKGSLVLNIFQKHQADELKLTHIKDCTFRWTLGEGWRWQVGREVNRQRQRARVPLLSAAPTPRPPGCVHAVHGSETAGVAGRDKGPEKILQPSDLVYQARTAPGQQNKTSR